MFYRYILLAIAALLFAGSLATGYHFLNQDRSAKNSDNALEAESSKTNTTDLPELNDETNTARTVQISKAKQAKIGVKRVQVTKGSWKLDRKIPAKLELDPARHYAVTAPATLIIEELVVPLGSEVKQGDPLLEMSSPQITVLRGGLVRQQLLTDKARQSLKWHREIEEEVKQLVMQLEKVLATPDFDWEPAPQRPVAAFGAKILSAYARYRAAAQLSAIATRVIESGALAEKSVVERRSERESTKALLRGEIEQSRFEIQQAILTAESDLAAAEGTLQSLQSDLRKYLGLRDWNNETIDDQSPKTMPDHFIYRSPGNGTVLERYFANGERAEAGDELVLVADIGSLWLVGDLRQQDWDLLTLKRGDVVHAEIIGLESQSLQEATVSMVGGTVKEGTGSIRLTANFPNPTRLFRPGMMARLVLSSERETTYIPESAIFTNDGVDYAIRQDDGNSELFHIEPITVGQRSQSGVEILSSLPEGTTIVSEGVFPIASEAFLERE